MRCTPRLGERNVKVADKHTTFIKIRTFDRPLFTRQGRLVGLSAYKFRVGRDLNLLLDGLDIWRSA